MSWTNAMWAVSVAFIFLVIGMTITHISDRWTDLADKTIQNNRTLMCEPVVCTCQYTSPYYYDNQYWDWNNTIYVSKGK